MNITAFVRYDLYPPTNKKSISILLSWQEVTHTSNLLLKRRNFASFVILNKLRTIIMILCYQYIGDLDRLSTTLLLLLLLLLVLCVPCVITKYVWKYNKSASDLFSSMRISSACLFYFLL